MKQFNGQVLFLNRSDINTDEIIPAKYLNENNKEDLKPYLFEDISIDGFNPKIELSNKSVIITRENFGCGSSREHAPWALEANGINIVLAESFARIFKQNMFNCGMLAVELPNDVIDRIFTDYSGTETQLTTQFDKQILVLENKVQTDSIPFFLGSFNKALVVEGGWVNYADSHY